ncbi:MAG: MBL fold metallo-hydrolase [Rhodobacteraceae bacterium]|nr:MBL fold metallo-hydrolase [Paracoccaceae bacterium]
MTHFTRRQALIGAAAAPLAAGLAGQVQANAKMMGASTANYHRIVRGGFEVTTILAAAFVRDNAQSIFGTNVSAEEFAAVSAANFLPADRVMLPVTPTVVNTGTELLLFDAGADPAGTAAALGNAGYTPEQIDAVVLTHMHPDHIGGLIGDSGPTFPNARIIATAEEHNFWAGNNNEVFNAKVKPLNDRVSFIEDGGSVAPGITAMHAFGHTPGHTTYLLDSEGAQLLIFGDTANHPVWSLGYPDWEVVFDIDKSMAAATRRRVLSMLAAEKMPFIGFHMPFPGMGFVETRGDGFRYVPVSYQMHL